MKIIYTPRALADLIAISQYLRERNPDAANAVITTIEVRAPTLGDSPLIGIATDEPGTRELIVLKYPYKIYYRVEGSAISVVHIRHTSRRPWRGGNA